MPHADACLGENIGVIEIGEEPPRQWNGDSASEARRLAERPLVAARPEQADVSENLHRPPLGPNGSRAYQEPAGAMPHGSPP